ncbi:MAG: diguanylate cyclase [Spirochaetes bacterium]|nr:diguanylate cyclase [Spirochaetota bacterium]
MKFIRKNKRIITACLIWVFLTAASFLWSYYKEKDQQRRLAFQVARSSFRQILDFREWNMSHGGVYAKVTEKFRPNPYLKIEYRDITANNEKYTLINPSFMTREISEITTGRSKIRFHMTSLNPVRPGNMPDDLETKALIEFEKGRKETGKFLSGKNKNSFFYMAPLKTERDCLRCHAVQGYKENDIRGGISIHIPFIPEIPVFVLIIVHSGVLLIGLTGIVISGLKLESAYSKIKKLADTDTLTGIPNRLGLTKQIKSELNRCRRDRTYIAVVMGDIDFFKNYNDKYGHVAGDKCLKKVARTIQDTLKRPGDFCARYGGEEFVMILPGTRPDGAFIIAEEIRKNILNLKMENRVSAGTEILSMSLGVISVKAEETGSEEELIKMADNAMYKAKKSGRNKVVLFDGH